MNIRTLSKTSTSSIVAILIIINVFIIAGISLFHIPANENIALVIITNSFSLATFVAGYYFNKKTNEEGTSIQTPGQVTIKATDNESKE